MGRIINIYSQYIYLFSTAQIWLLIYFEFILSLTLLAVIFLLKRHLNRI
nr:MAG TPA: hypothetical protein [Caudoviricetes sp.]